MRILAVVCLCVIGAACTDRSTSPSYPAALAVGTPKTVLAATSRAAQSDGTFGYNRAERLSLLEMVISIPPNHEPGELKFGYAIPRPETQFTVAARNPIPDFQSFDRRLDREIGSIPNGEREVTLFIHGYNATQAETAFRAAQLAHDLKLPGAMAIYSWPSRGKALGYAYDTDSLLFARDDLETVLVNITQNGNRRVVLVAHSIGSLLLMEALRQIEIARPGWASKSVAGVILISPDLSVDVFRQQVDRIKTLPQPFAILVSRRDGTLDISGRLRGQQERLGNIRDLGQISDLPIEIIDTTEIAGTGRSAHFVPATSPAYIKLLNKARDMNATFGASETSFEDLIGTETTAPPGELRQIRLTADTGGNR